jgi:hypothetical protein
MWDGHGMVHTRMRNAYTIAVRKTEGEKQLGRPGYGWQDNIMVTWELKAKIVEQEEAAVARQQHGKHVSIATDSNATTENTVFLCGPCQGPAGTSSSSLVSLEFHF